MNKFKKLASFFLAFVMMFGTVLHISAEETKLPEDGSIKIENAVDGQKYDLYRILDLEIVNGDAYAYTINEKYKGFLDIDENITNQWLIKNNGGYIEWNPSLGTDSHDLAQAFFTWIESQKPALEPDETGTKEAGKELIFPGLDLGVYLVKSSLGSVVSLDTNHPNAVIKEKNTETTVTKKVKEDSIEAPADPYKDKNDATVGDVVEFKATIDLTGTTSSLTFHDTMDTGLDFISNDGITVTYYPGGNMNAGVNWERNVDYVDVPNPVHEKENGDSVTHTFDIRFPKVTENNPLNNGDKIVITYTATLNSEAVKVDKVNNTSYVDYKDAYDNEFESPESKTETYTWDFNIFKFGEENTPLKDVEFTLYSDVECQNPIKFSQVQRPIAGTDQTELVYVVDAKGSEILKTDGAGYIKIDGLDEGTYYLKETKAVAGYNPMKEVVVVTITSTVPASPAEASYAFTSNGSIVPSTGNTVKIVNKKGTELPGTGGIGTTMFYTVGGALVLGAAVLLITKKRAKAE